jgi:lipopolysaccharide heptosyltransferase I
MRVLLVRLSSFGDVVFTLPAAKALVGPGDELAWAIEAPLAPLVAGAPYVHAVFAATTRSWRRRPFAAETRRELRAFLASVRAFAPDVVVDAQGLFKSAWATFVAPARRKVGFGFASATERVSCLALDERVDTPARHLADRALALAAHVTGGRRASRRPDVTHLATAPLSPELSEWTAARDGRPFALLQPFSSAPAKEWRAEDVLRFARLTGGEGVACAVRWGPAERGRAEALAAASGGALTLAPATGPGDIAALACRAVLFVGADSGPTHLAAAAGVPTIALFGPTDAGRFGPIGERALAWPLPGYNSPRTDSPERAARDLFSAARSLIFS